MRLPAIGNCMSRQEENEGVKDAILACAMEQEIAKRTRRCGEGEERRTYSTAYEVLETPEARRGAWKLALRTPSWGNVSDQGRDCVYLGPEPVTILWRVQCTAYKLAVTWLCYPSPPLISGCALTLALTLGTPPLDLRHAPPPFFGFLGREGLALRSRCETCRPFRLLSGTLSLG